MASWLPASLPIILDMKVGRPLDADVCLSRPSLRRLTPGDGYLEALIQPNVLPVYSDITHIDEAGLATEDGKHYDVDVIVCATGFDMAWTPHFELLGVDGVRIQDAWHPIPNPYLGMAAPGFPNYWVMNGPRGNLCNGTVCGLESSREEVCGSKRRALTIATGDTLP